MTSQALLDRLVALVADFRASTPTTALETTTGRSPHPAGGVNLLRWVLPGAARGAARRPGCGPPLGAFVSECIAPADDGPLDNAAATCFVEDIVGEPWDRELPHLTGEASRYWQAWRGHAEPGALMVKE